jgi:hypothetical protein
MAMTMFPANGDGKHAMVPDPGDKEGGFDVHSGLEDLWRWKEDHRRWYLLLQRPTLLHSNPELNLSRFFLLSLDYPLSTTNTSTSSVCSCDASKMRIC